MKKNLKRIVTALIGFPLVAILFIYGNAYMIDIAFSIVALLSIREYFHVFSKKAHPVRWVRIFSSNTYSFYACDTEKVYTIGYRYVCSSNNISFIYSSNNF